jgi:hypothetical protein
MGQSSYSSIIINLCPEWSASVHRKEPPLGGLQREKKCLAHSGNILDSSTIMPVVTQSTERKSQDRLETNKLIEGKDVLVLK